MLGFACLTE